MHLIQHAHFNKNHEWDLCYVYICKHIILTKYMLKTSKQQQQQQRATFSLTVSYNYQLFILKEKKKDDKTARWVSIIEEVKTEWVETSSRHVTSSQ